MSHSTMIERVTRSLAYMLRHKPEEFDLQLDRQGFADLSEVVQALNERLGEPIEEAQVSRAISCGDRERYEIVDGRIRALYGHSIEVDPGEPSQPPEFLYIGVAEGDAERARRNGLHGGRRRFLHLGLTQADAIETGRRIARDYVVITVRALDAWEQDVNFYDRRAMFLSEPIPTEFIEVGEVRHDGSPRQDRRERGDRHGRGDRRGRGERHGEGRGSRGGDRSRSSDRGRRGRGPERDGEGAPRGPRPERERSGGDRAGREGGRSGRRRPEHRAPERREPERRESSRPVTVGAAPRSDSPARGEEAPSQASSSSSSSPRPAGFGTGVFEPVPAAPDGTAPPAGPPAAEPASAPPPEEAREPEPQPQPEAEAEAERPSEGSEEQPFGSGL